jgi:hypothetical protein
VLERSLAATDPTSQHRNALAPRPRQAPADGWALPVTGIGPEALALYDRSQHGVVPMWRLDHLRWLTDGFASTCSFVALYFARGDELAGRSLLRVYTGADGRQAQIVDLFAPRADADLFTWMVPETSCVAAGFRPDVVNALTTSRADTGLASQRLPPGRLASNPHLGPQAREPSGAAVLRRAMG